METVLSYNLSAFTENFNFLSFQLSFFFLLDKIHEVLSTHFDDILRVECMYLHFQTNKKEKKYIIDTL